MGYITDHFSYLLKVLEPCSGGLNISLKLYNYPPITMAAESDSDTTVTTAVGGLVAVLAIVAVTFRFYTRYFTKAGLGWDDWLILLSLIVAIATDIVMLYGLFPLFPIFVNHQVRSRTFNHSK